MKILNIIHAQSIGGVDQVFRYYNEAFLENENQLAIVISDNGHDNYQPSNTKNNLFKKIYKLKNITPALDIIDLLYIFYTFRPDVIICHSLRTMSWMRFLKYLTPAKTIAVNHGITYKKSLHCEYVFSINEKIKEMVISDGKHPDKSFFIPNMIKIDSDFIKKSFHNPPVIGMFGRIEPRKGFDILIKAAGILKNKNIDFRLILGGFACDKNYDEAYLMRLAKENNVENETKFVGIVKDKKTFFNEIDIFCVPSREEPFGMVIIESFLHSTPVISSDSEGAKLITHDNHDALIFPNENYEILAKKIEQLIIDNNLATQIAKNAFVTVKTNYSLEMIGKKIQKTLEAITSKA